MAARGAVHQISPSGADIPAAEGVSDTTQSRFSDEGTTQNTEGRHVPATDSNQDNDAQSSVSGTTAVETGLGVDPGSRAQARARDLEDEISRFCADPSNRITVSCRNYIMTRVFELVSLCSDLRADAASERGAAIALQCQLVEARREIAGLQRRVLVAETPAVGDVLAGASGVHRLGGSSLADPGGSAAVEALSSRKNTDPHIADMKRALCHIGSASPIRLYHVPWRAGVFGNEIADYVASRAARQGDPRPLQWSLRNVRAVFRTELYRRWALQWSREDEDTALYKWVPDPRELPDYFPPNKALVTLLTGHGRFHSYFHRFKLLRDPRCFCGAPCDSVEHYLLDCQATRHLAEQLQPKASRDNAC
ncbi:hypothetical protein MTO96_042141 [Rhipicephalus appendiculatus]